MNKHIIFQTGLFIGFILGRLSYNFFPKQDDPKPDRSDLQNARSYFLF